MLLGLSALAVCALYLFPLLAEVMAVLVLQIVGLWLCAGFAMSLILPEKTGRGFPLLFAINCAYGTRDR